MRLVTEKKRKEEQAQTAGLVLLVMIMSFIAGLLAAPYLAPFLEELRLSLQGSGLPFVDVLLPEPTVPPESE